MENETYLAMNVDNRSVETAAAVTPLLSYGTLDQILLLTYFVCAALLSLLGIFTNVVNIVVFSKLGFSESTNIYFLALSMFDLLFVVLFAIASLLYSPLAKFLSNGPFIRYVGESMSRSYFVLTNGSAMMTALISVERCLCVLFPLKIKTVLSPRKRVCLMLTVVAYHVIFLIIMYADPGPPYDDYTTEKLTFYLASLYGVPFSAVFFIVVMTTTFIAIQMRRTRQWRREAANQSNKNKDKETAIVRTIIAINVLFIFCSLPTVGHILGSMMIPNYIKNDPYWKSLIDLFYAIGYLFQIISSSVNIFFYYKMSSRFRNVFSKCFRFGQKKNNNLANNAEATVAS
ncbi:chemosensory receptor A [Elysia marginata]|uniref:Chemosensory receptor A n=1 Tax=Elysia marginata TaxID=1093978 RepID=A0AAV4GK28_9GAST|nr:chemosensory receptor A [Elysia marginata]